MAAEKARNSKTKKQKIIKVKSLQSSIGMIDYSDPTITEIGG